MIFKSLKKKTEKKLKHTNFNCGCVFFDTRGIKNILAAHHEELTLEKIWLGLAIKALEKCESTLLALFWCLYI